jgi:hypothetical protein
MGNHRALATERLTKQMNPDGKILFEHRFDLVSDHDLHKCYAWVHALLGG